MAKIRNPIIVGESVDFSTMDGLLDEMEDLLDELDNTINGAYVGGIQPYLTFSSPNSFTLSTNNSTKNWDGTLEYSTNKTNWTEWSGTTAISSGVNGSDNVLYIRGTGNTYIVGNSNLNRWNFVGSNISCSGNIENLLDYQTVLQGNHPPVASYCYYYIFSNCTSLITAPSLSATTLAPYCCTRMFSGCTNLEQLPSLPALVLSSYCYGRMFTSCRKIKISQIQTGDYQNSYRIPTANTGTDVGSTMTGMFSGTGGTFTDTPTINTTYYTSNAIVNADGTITPAVGGN